MAEVVVFGVVAADVVLRIQRIPAPGDHVSAEALGWRIGGSSANVACGLSTAGHHVRLVGPVGTDSMGDHLLAGLEQRGVDTGYCFRADAASPRTLILLDDTGERTIITVDSGAGPSSFLPARGPDLRSVDCVYIEGYTSYPAGTAAGAESALVVTSPPVPGIAAWPATVVAGSETQYSDVTSAGMFEAVRSVSGERLEWVVVTRGREGADAYATAASVHVDAVAADQVDATGASRLPWACCTSCCKGTTWPQRSTPALCGVRRQWPSCDRFQCLGRNSPARSASRATADRCPGILGRSFRCGCAFVPPHCPGSCASGIGA